MPEPCTSRGSSCTTAHGGARSDPRPPPAHPSQGQKGLGMKHFQRESRLLAAPSPSVCPWSLRTLLSHSFHLQATKQKLQRLVRNCQNQSAGQRWMSQAFSGDISDTPTQAAASSTYQPCSQHLENGTDLTAAMQKTEWEEEICKGLVLFKHSRTLISGQPL